MANKKTEVWLVKGYQGGTDEDTFCSKLEWALDEIREDKGTVIDIKYSTAYVTHEDNVYHSALIIYETDSEQNEVDKC